MSEDRITDADRARAFCESHHCVGQVVGYIEHAANVRDLAAEFAAVRREAMEEAAKIADIINSNVARMIRARAASTDRGSE